MNNLFLGLFQYLLFKPRLLFSRIAQPVNILDNRELSLLQELVSTLLSSSLSYSVF